MTTRSRKEANRKTASSVNKPVKSIEVFNKNKKNKRASSCEELQISISSILDTSSTSILNNEKPPPTPTKAELGDVGGSPLAWLYNYCGNQTESLQGENLFDDPNSLSLLVSPCMPSNYQNSNQVSYTPNMDLDISLSLLAPFQSSTSTSMLENRTPPSSRHLNKDSGSCLSALIKGEVNGHDFLSFSPSLFSPPEKSNLLREETSEYVSNENSMPSIDYFPNQNQNYCISNPRGLDSNSSSATSKNSIMSRETATVNSSEVLNQISKLKDFTSLHEKKKVKKQQVLVPTHTTSSFSSPFTSQLGDNSVNTAIATAATDQETIAAEQRAAIAADSICNSGATSLSSLGGGSVELPCKCKKSRCLKLYCDCFAILKYCNKLCSCRECANNVNEKENIVMRERAVKTIKEKNHLAFQTKITEKEGMHAAGCHCKQSQCLKKYCECFHGGALCGPNCKCQNCFNFNGSEHLEKAKANVPNLLSIIDVQTQSPDGDGGPAEVVNTDKGGVSLKRKESPASLSEMSSDSTPPQREGDLSRVISKTISTDVEATSSIPVRSSLVPSESRRSLRDHTKSAIVGIGELTDGNAHKKRRVQFCQNVILYPFFGHTLPPTPKLVALKILDYLPSKDIYSMSIVNSLLSQAATDDALWE